MANFPEIVAHLQRLSTAVQGVFVGKPEVVRRCLIGLVAGGHLLIEDVPGVGKSVLAQSLAGGLAGKFSRIQFTPDMLPSDVLGVSVYDANTKRFEFKPGPIFANVVLADEINRTTPRTQSALLEAMNEGQVSLDGQTHPLPEPFLVIATQNPYEFEGTYPLPENQLDRFLLRIRIGYPSRDSEREVLRTRRNRNPLTELSAVMSGAEVLAARQAAGRVRVAEEIYDYILDLATASRSDPNFRYGVSIRGSLALLKSAQAAALLEGRDYVVPDDVKGLAVSVWAHRVVLRSRYRDPSLAGWASTSALSASAAATPGGEEPAEAAIRALLASVPCP